MDVEYQQICPNNTLYSTYMNFYQTSVDKDHFMAIY